MIRILLILFLLTGCSQQQVRTHIGTGAGVVTGFMTCHELLQANIELTVLHFSRRYVRIKYVL